jgi:hypothetical protein
MALLDPGPTGLDGKWSLGDRSHPILNSNNDTGDNNSKNRDYYWVPFIRDANGNPASPNWQIYVMILRRSKRLSTAYPNTPAADYANPNDGPQAPTIRSISVNFNTLTPQQFQLNGTAPSVNTDRKIEEGDWILDNNGGVHRVVEVDFTSTAVIRVEGFISVYPNTPTQIWIGAEAITGSADPVISIATFSGEGFVVRP